MAAARAHYIVRVGNEGLAPTVSAQAPNHWHYLSAQHLWGFPRGMTHVNVRAAFEADIANPRVTAYIWFLCNGHGGPGHFVQVGIGMHHTGTGPAVNEDLPIPADMMTRLQEGFDHWFQWRPVVDFHPNAATTFQDRVRRLPIPQPTYIPTLRHVLGDHPSLPRFEALIDDAEHQRQQAAAAVAITTALLPPRPVIEAIDLENIRREQIEPHSQGFVYLIHMEDTGFYKIGMSLDPEIRLRTLQTGNPHLLHLHSTQAVGDMRSAEIGLHRQFEDHRVPNVNVREWFDFGHGAGEVEIAFRLLGQ